MSLWNKTDVEGSRPKFINLASYPAGTQLVFVDATEAANPTNRSKGIKSAGWHLYRESVDSNGQIRYYTESVVALAETAALAGDATDDLFVPDVTTTVTISVQPADQTTALGGATFSVTAALTPAGTVTYQWQKKSAGATRWAAVDGATAASLALTAQTADNTGDQYRVVVAGAGAKAVTSTAAVLTFGT